MSDEDEHDRGLERRSALLGSRQGHAEHATGEQRQEFSTGWAIASTVIFFATELVLGGIVGELVVGRYKSLGLAFVLQGVLNLASYFIGGFIIGLVSPGVRIIEPAVGAFCSVALMLALTLFTPYAFIRFSLTKLVIGGGVAFALAFIGARLGERVAGNRIDWN